ncbi:MAG: hypothetical protein PHI23_00150 [Candidatus Peribacteraceae bacterium]|nr:hypothetical protein [Candidatus Peribacteraceae bacterium]
MDEKLHALFEHVYETRYHPVETSLQQLFTGVPTLGWRMYDGETFFSVLRVRQAIVDRSLAEHCTDPKLDVPTNCPPSDEVAGLLQGTWEAARSQELLQREAQIRGRVGEILKLYLSERKGRSAIIPELRQLSTEFSAVILELAGIDRSRQWTFKLPDNDTRETPH